MRLRQGPCRPADLPLLAVPVPVSVLPSLSPPLSSPASSRCHALRPLFVDAMKFSTAALSATLVALASGAAAQLEVIAPGGPNLWWIAESDNVVTWTCKTSPYTNFTVSIANKDVKVLTSPLPFISQQNNFDCSKLITKDQVNMAPATGYTIQLSNPFNLTDIYAESQEFEIKALGAPYPASSATPTLGGSATGSGAGSASATGSTPSATGGASGSNGASGLSAPGTLAAVAVAAFGLIFA
ncbi:hypothetical protein K466DRAFT_586326 [Polyporus arcularius HHB13444]|uniref:Uncharacterized protein n=1 Tax=Polyporus arcularius HHB13444 TaxID=1314778 RepID=A0A5C3PND0_9APHY|nr:hypothetical protein K466DRAFT_586326 [Polyporus arcularius HHB13444]